MGKLANALQAVVLAGLAAVGTSCATHNAGPPVAKAHKGYVDFYSPGTTNLYWSVKRLDPATGAFKTVFYKLKPVPDGVLRLELNPGPQQLQITCLNRVIPEPLTLQVPIQEGRVTPVKVELVPVAETSIERQQEVLGANVRHSARRTSYSSQAGTTERLVASVQPAAPYQPKPQMSYPP